MTASTGRVLLVGAVTWDVFGSERRAGGAVTFAARAAAAVGVQARILTITGADANVSAFEGHESHVVPSVSTLTFEHDVHEEQRRLRLLARPERALTTADIPREWLDSAAVVLAPLLTDDIDVASFARAGFGRAGLIGQGLQRTVDGDGRVRPAERPSDALKASLSPRCSLFLSEDECLSWTETEFRAVVARCERVVVTRGAAGADVFSLACSPARLGDGGEGEVRRQHVPASPARVVDTTGAGDVFATGFFLGMAVRGLDSEAAGELASRLAAAKVERVGAVALPRM